MTQQRAGSTAPYLCRSFPTASPSALSYPLADPSPQVITHEHLLCHVQEPNRVDYETKGEEDRVWYEEMRKQGADPVQCMFWCYLPCVKLCFYVARDAIEYTRSMRPSTWVIIANTQQISEPFREDYLYGAVLETSNYVASSRSKSDRKTEPIDTTRSSTHETPRVPELQE